MASRPSAAGAAGRANRAPAGRSTGPACRALPRSGALNGLIRSPRTNGLSSFAEPAAFVPAEAAPSPEVAGVLLADCEQPATTTAISTNQARIPRFDIPHSFSRPASRRSGRSAYPYAVTGYYAISYDWSTAVAGAASRGENHGSWSSPEPNGLCGQHDAIFAKGVER